MSPENTPAEMVTEPIRYRLPEPIRRTHALASG